MVNCTFYLLALAPGIAPRGFSSTLLQKAAPAIEILVSGIPDGWVHRPLQQDAARLTSHDWDLFIVTRSSLISLVASINDSIAAYITAEFTIPQHQYERFVLERRTKCAGKPSKHPVHLPAEWTDTDSNALHIPREHIVEAYNGAAKADGCPATTALNGGIPVQRIAQQCAKEAAIHDMYMRDFEKGFGDSAGAYVKFMGPVLSQLRDGQDSTSQAEFETETENRPNGRGWQDVDLVHYDTIYHYAYMLSTELYQQFNEDKVRGLEDTCILLVSEYELS